MLIELYLTSDEVFVMKKMSFREAQLGAYNVLKYIDKICRENNFKYFLMYGSLIGAVRNKGIIPWDDDIAVMMPRPDYDRLIKYCQENASNMEHFKLFENWLANQESNLDFRNQNPT